MRAIAYFLSVVVCSYGLAGTPLAHADDEAGFHSLFNGTSLSGWRPWKGDEGFWRVEDGTITGESTSEKPLDHNTFLTWDHGDVDDFELRLQFKLTGTKERANSGIQFRGQQADDGHFIGYQADIDLAGNYCGSLHDEAGRNGLAARGERATITVDGKHTRETIANRDELQKHIKDQDWNDYSIICQGNRITLKINGHVTCELLDDQKDPGHDPSRQADRIGLLALQMHQGPPQKIQFKNIRLKRLPLAEGKKVVFIAGAPSHGWGAHEHNAGCLLLANRINESGLPVIATVYRSGWPKDISALDNADTVVSYCDGGGAHYLNDRLEDFQQLVDTRHIGLVCIHYAVETTKGNCGDHFLNWIGGYFEPHWSVNPHWIAKYSKFPEHQITRGVAPFEINDEWYYHMRFPEGMKNVTPILTDMPPRETLEHGDGTHSGNPFVRAAVLERKEPQHMAWAFERPDNKGRGFGFTGGHDHRNWQNDQFRKVVLNAIIWTAGLDVPTEGVSSATPTNEEMDANQDEPKPENVQTAQKTSEQLTGHAQAKPVASSPILTTQSPNHSVELEADITGAKQLFLVVTDGGDSFSCDWADWAEPRLVGPDGEKKLTDLKWKSATSDWGNPAVGKNANGGPLSIHGKAVEYGIGTHANSMILYDLPEGHPSTKLKVRVGIDNGGSNQGGSSIQFHVFTQRPPKSVLDKLKTTGGSHELADAMSQLDVGEGLVGSLFAGEPQLFNPTDIDIDHLGRVWVCEAVNYRAFANKEVIADKGDKGDRLVIVEDVNHDGTADQTHVFFQGHEVDSAHGICVLPTPNGRGTRVIVSVGDKVWNFYDDDGDLKADRHEVMFSGIDGSQHDHGIHAFVFGPDGKLYFNFGNAGRHIKDKNGNPIVDKAGNIVDDSRQPYQEGMIFRCDLDGSNFETLAWNFRNNWEVTIDSFGGLWQSDNDDDGNRGVRINYVVEYGNYGYKDEKSGAGWQAYRTGWEDEIPLRHWHLNDPGVMPNLLQTGAGAPTGICLYEGDLLPPVFRGQPIHCDAGPNVVRAYPSTPYGAGYTATMVNVLQGTHDNWFRPSDVCVAPDGSLVVSDWYDPGVGGHRMGDADKGRLFRISVPGHNSYTVPDIDVSTPSGAVEALQSPNMATRYMAWQALHQMGEQAEAALTTLYHDPNPRFRARALWLLGKQDNHQKQLSLLKSALQDADAEIRCTAVRLGRQLADRLDSQQIGDAVNLRDPSPAVRRELLIGLRESSFDKVPQLPQAWAELAIQYDGQDRWYLEALGIAAEGRWDAMLDAWKAAGGNPDTPAGRDIIWRSRGNQTPAALVKIISDPATTAAQLPRYFRAFDFLSGEEVQKAIADLAFTEVAGDAARQNMIASEAISRLQGDVVSNPKYASAIERVLEAQKGTANFVRLVERLKLKDQYPALLELAISKPEEQLGVEAASVLLNQEQWDLFGKAIHGEPTRALATVTVLGLTADGKAVGLLMDPVKTKEASIDVRRAAAKALGNIRYGAQELAKLAGENGVTPDLKDVVAATLHGVQWPDIKEAAVKLYPLPPGKDSEPIPPLPELANRNGEVPNGRIVFNTTGTCNKCHIVNGIGRDVGPNLSEIGKKLSKQALYESILYPSAGISHNYEQWSVTTVEGQVFSGLLVSSTDTETQIKDINGIIKTIKQSQIEDKIKQSVSLMPADLQKVMTVKEMTDVVEYLTTLKEAKSVEKK